MHLFITGGTGSIGTAVLKHAIAKGHQVTALSRSEAADLTLTAAGAAPWRGTLETPAQWTAQAAQADVFIHLASSFDDAMALHEPQMLQTLNHHAAARDTPLRLIYTGGCWLYGETGNAVAHEGSPLRPIASFDWAAQAIKSLPELTHLSCTVIHPAMVYDPDGGVFSRMIRALRAGRPAPIWGNDAVRWPLVHADDLALAYLLVAQSPQATGVYNIVAQQGVPLGEIADHLSALAGIRTRPAVLPRKWVLARHGAWGEGPMLDQQMRSTRMTELGWAPQHPDFSAQTFGF